jgi:hypothetical protein
MGSFENFLLSSSSESNHKSSTSHLYLYLLMQYKYYDLSLRDSSRTKLFQTTHIRVSKSSPLLHVQKTDC